MYALDIDDNDLDNNLLAFLSFANLELIPDSPRVKKLMGEYCITNGFGCNGCIRGIIYTHIFTPQWDPNGLCGDLTTEGDAYCFMKGYAAAVMKKNECFLDYYDIEEYMDPDTYNIADDFFQMMKRNGDMSLLSTSWVTEPRGHLAYVWKLEKEICQHIPDKYKTHTRYWRYDHPRNQHFINTFVEKFGKFDTFIVPDVINNFTGFGSKSLCRNTESIMRAIDFILGHERRHIYQYSHQKKMEDLYLKMARQPWVQMQLAMGFRPDKIEEIFEEMDADRYGLIHMVKMMHKRKLNPEITEMRKHLPHWVTKIA